MTSIGRRRKLGPARRDLHGRCNPRQAYFPLTHGWTGSGYVTVRTAMDAAAVSDGVRRAILDMDPTQAPAGEPTPERGGRARKYFRVEPAGKTALGATRRALEVMWEGVSI